MCWETMPAVSMLLSMCMAPLQGASGPALLHSINNSNACSKALTQPQAVFLLLQ